MIDNTTVAEIVELTGKLLDLHDKDEVRSKTYLSAAFNIGRQEIHLSTQSLADLQKIKGIGKLIANNILEILETGTLKELEELSIATPNGIFDLMKIKGLGVKKIKILWKDLAIESISQLKSEALLGSIAALKGFGDKSQDAILDAIRFFEAQQGKVRMDKALMMAQLILEKLKESYPLSEIVGEVARKAEIVSAFYFLTQIEGFGNLKLPEDFFTQDIQNSNISIWRGTFLNIPLPIAIEKVSANNYIRRRLILNSAEAHLRIERGGQSFYHFIRHNIFDSESAYYKHFGSKYIVPEMREGLAEFEWVDKYKESDLLKYEDLKGPLHNHSTYSDGRNTLKEMADFAQQQGWEYFGIADHSQSAQYAGGLRPDQIENQHREIDKLNELYQGFKILKGVESDILPNGDLDYTNDILATFDYVVASVHSVLNMDIEKATSRLIKAIENPYTHILGHMSGRLLLTREGYPLDVQKIVDACAANKVSIELNASPYRLDIDWRHLHTCMEKGVRVSINPDAHSTEGLLDMKYGTWGARKGGLVKEMTLNCFDLTDLLYFFRRS